MVFCQQIEDLVQTLNLRYMSINIVIRGNDEDERNEGAERDEERKEIQEMTEMKGDEVYGGE